MRTLENINQNWLFAPQELELGTHDEQFSAITLPHSNKLFSHRIVDNNDYQFVSTYRKYLTLPEDAIGKRIFIDFDAVMLMATVYINGQLLGVHKGGYTPFSFEITDYVQSGENCLMVYVDSTERTDIPPYGGRVDYLTFGGIYRDVYLRVVEACHIVSIFAKPKHALASPELDCDIQISQLLAGIRLTLSLEDSQRQIVAQADHDVRTETFTLSMSNLDSIVLWSIDNPYLYHLTAELSIADEPIDKECIRLGFRSAEFREDGRFYLNGEALNLFGLNRHQIYPYIGAAAPERLQKMDADILKYELGCNIVRTSHYAQSPYFLNHCDEIGLLVFEELAGWQHIGDAAWQELVIQDLEAMILRDRHHPSIILWGVRVNESRDNDALYTRTNALAHELDPTRQTGGVRDFIQSHFLEDVFTLNDFPEGIQTPLVRPHLITEFAGHMFPTKTWDQEERRVEHALVHARKHNLQMGHPDVAGGIAWCAFDYNTHKNFGSGDRICHHGVMDIFRLPKMAAYFYRSQKSPEDEVVLYAATSWTMGDRSGGGNNPLVIFSNCDEIELLIGKTSHGRFKPARDEYPHLPYPPFVIKWSHPYNPWGTETDDLEVRGFINEDCVAQHRISSEHSPQGLRVKADATHLKADAADMTRVAIRIVDKYENVLPYQFRAVTLTLEGHAELIGENPLLLIGGQSACFIKSTHQTGNVILTAYTEGLEPVSIELQITD